MSTASGTTKSFRGVVGGVTYTDTALFESAAHDLGYRPFGERKRTWKVGVAVRVTMTDGTKIDGQVWSKGEVDNYVWVALDDGTFVSIFIPTGAVARSPRGDQLGKVAA